MRSEKTFCASGRVRLEKGKKFPEHLYGQFVGKSEPVAGDVIVFRIRSGGLQRGSSSQPRRKGEEMGHHEPTGDNNP